MASSPAILLQTGETATIALTTVFHPPADCTKPILRQTQIQTIFGPVPTDPSLTGIEKFESTCYPSLFILTNYPVVFSPGVCPSGFSIAAERFQLPLRGSHTTTLATCCPTAARLGTESGFCNSGPVSALTYVDKAGQTDVFTSRYVIVVPPITVAWQSSDLPNLPATSTKNATATSPTTSQSQNNSILSTGAKAGIGVGVVAGVLIVIGLVAWIILTRRKQREREAAVPEVGSSRGNLEPKYDRDSAPIEMGSPDTIFSELDSEQRN